MKEGILAFVFVLVLLSTFALADTPACDYAYFDHNTTAFTGTFDCPTYNYTLVNATITGGQTFSAYDVSMDADCDLDGSLIIAGTGDINDKAFTDLNVPGGSVTVYGASISTLTLTSNGAVTSTGGTINVTTLTLTDGSVTNLFYANVTVDLDGTEITVSQNDVTIPTGWAVLTWANFSSSGDTGKLYYIDPVGVSEDELELVMFNGSWIITAQSQDTTNNYFELPADMSDLYVIMGNTTPHDATVPSVLLRSPVNNANLTSATFGLIFNVSDTSNIEKCDLYLNGTLSQTLTSVSKNTDQTFSVTLGSGGHRWYVSCTDVWGNADTSSEWVFSLDVDSTLPDATVGLSATTIEIGQSVTVTCEGTDDDGIANVTAASESTIICTSSTESCEDTYQPDETGTYEVNCTAYDTNGNMYSEYLLLIVNEVGSSDTTTPSNGNDNTTDNTTDDNTTDDSTDDTSNVESAHDVTDIAVSAGETETFEITNDVPASAITITAKNNISDGSLTVSLLTDKPDDISQAPLGEVYGYLQIDTEIVQDDIENVTIKFTIPKSWLDENNINATDVVLSRYTTYWEELQTTLITEITNETTEVEYEAVAPGFSVFAITVSQLGFMFEPSFEIMVITVMIGVIAIMFYLKEKKGYSIDFKIKKKRR